MLTKSETKKVTDLVEVTSLNDTDLIPVHNGVTLRSVTFKNIKDSTLGDVDLSSVEEKIATNTTNIANLQTQVGNIDLSSVEEKVEANETSISTLQTKVNTNTTNISTNTSNIATNKTNIATNTSNISSINTKIAPLLYDNAGAHNAIYRGKALGSSVTTAQYTAIGNGTFTDLYIGDYWTINSVNWRIAGFDYYLGCGDLWANSSYTTTKHHIVIVPDTVLYSAQMNTSNTTSGGYAGSAMYTSNLANAKTTINNAFGSSHVLSHRICITNAVSSGHPSGVAWVDSTVDLMNEYMVYGAPHFHPMDNGDIVDTNYEAEKSQLPLFAHDHSRITIAGIGWWLRDVASASDFCFVGNGGAANSYDASYSNGVRPAFCLVQA